MRRAMLAVILLAAGCSVSVGGSVQDGQPTATPDTGPGPGRITFGIGLTDDLLVVDEQNTFAVGDPISYSAAFSEEIGATSMKLIIASVSDSGTESVIHSETISVPDPSFDLFGLEDFDLSALVDNVPGTYVMRYFRDATKLAEGEFTIE